MSGSDEVPEEASAAPPLSDELRRQAAEHPGGYLYVVDPEAETADRWPSRSVRGWYAVDEDGQIGSWHANPEHGSSDGPWPVPSDPVEAAIVGLARGEGDDVALVETIRASAVWAVADEEGGALLATDADGEDYCAVYSRPSNDLGRRYSLEETSGALLLDALPRPITLLVNADGPIGIRIRIDD